MLALSLQLGLPCGQCVQFWNKVLKNLSREKTFDWWCASLVF